MCGTFYEVTDMKTSVYTLIPQKNALLIKRAKKDFLTLPMTFEVNGTRYSPTLAKKQGSILTYRDGAATMVVSLHEDFFTVYASLTAEADSTVMSMDFS